MKKQLLSLVFTLSFLSLLSGQELNYSNLDNNLIDAIEKGGSSEFDIYIILEDKVDLSTLNQSLRSQNLDRTERAKIVMASLSQKAKQSQGNLISELQSDNGVEKESIHSYWLANIVFMKANKKAIAKLSNDPRIEFIGIDGQLQLVESEDEYAAMAAPDGVESGLERINVRPLWDLGYTGYGRLALVADTGIDPTHRSFGHRYRGNTNGDNEGWYAYNNQQASPFQCGDHGTHVLGTVLGLDRLNRDTIGVAFDAQWLGSANLCGGGTQSNIGTFQWSVNPDDNLDTVDDMADVINNSWWDPSVFGEDCNSVYVDVLEALEVMGVVVVFSGGNAGPDPATMTSPHNINIDFVNTFTVAALNGNNNQLEVADFSSRGPSTCGGEGSLLIKPEVAAPGVTVRSAVLENEYGFKSGTSMAAPHVAGAVLILRQAFPEIGSRELKLALYNTCADLGEPGEDNVYGMGIIDVFAAYNYLIAEGYEPAPPVSMENDLMAYDLITDRFECNETLTSEFVFFNNSVDTLRSMDIVMTIDGNADEAITIPWVGDVAPFMLDTIMLDAIDFETGTHEVALEIMNPNGNVDERSLNNKILKTVLISSNERLETISLEEQVTCRNADILIKADYEGDGTIQWFDEATGGNLIAEGTQIAIAASSPRTIYGDILRTTNNGKKSSDAVIFNTFNDQETGIEFNALFPFRITAFDFYSEQVGNIFLGVENGRRDQIESEIFKSDGSGWQTAEVSIRVPEGFGYRLLYKDGAAELGVSNTDLDYPYLVDNVMSITGGTNGNRYNYFYNLRVEYLDLCGRVPVEISTVPTDSLPVASFEVNVDFVDIANNQEIQFFNSAENAISYEWDFGDGSTSIEENPIHTYTEGGIYYPSLLVYNAEGCSDAFVGRVEIFDATTSVFNTVREERDFEIAPNPFSQKLNFKTDLPVQVEYIEIYNSAGLLTKTFQVNNRISFHSEQIGELVSGLYYVLIHTENGVESHKVIKH